MCGKKDCYVSFTFMLMLNNLGTASVDFSPQERVLESLTVSSLGSVL